MMGSENFLPEAHPRIGNVFVRLWLFAFTIGSFVVVVMVPLSTMVGVIMIAMMSPSTVVGVVIVVMIAIMVTVRTMSFVTMVLELFANVRVPLSTVIVRAFVLLGAFDAIGDRDHGSGRNGLGDCHDIPLQLIGDVLSIDLHFQCRWVGSAVSEREGSLWNHLTTAQLCDGGQAFRDIASGDIDGDSVVQVDHIDVSVPNLAIVRRWVFCVKDSRDDFRQLPLEGLQSVGQSLWSQTLTVADACGNFVGIRFGGDAGGNSGANVPAIRDEHDAKGGFRPKHAGRLGCLEQAGCRDAVKEREKSFFTTAGIWIRWRL